MSVFAVVAIVLAVLGALSIFGAVAFWLLWMIAEGFKH